MPSLRFLFGVPALLVGMGMASAEPVLTGEAAPCTDAPDQVRLHVAVSGVRNDRGTVTVTVYGDVPADFLAPGRKLARVRAPARAGLTDVCLAVPPRSAYAVALYHDENDDRDFNRTLLGLPAEGYGVSNDAPTLLGIPSYDSARITAHPGDNDVAITIHY
ncbi:DUF2141 domain-containing protein [Azospirillum sp. ST 5-10]|uniref:DUF2141 domain-containing protein n=1 Tax=unclassified Azospirillum TaxID=2630922 RepID=UPI003F4A7B8A